MAVKKQAIKKRRSAPKANKTAVVGAKKAVSRRKKRVYVQGFLSELANPATMKGAATAMFSGLIGGGIVRTVDKLLPQTWGNGSRILVNGVGSFLLAGVGRMPHMAAGMMGALAFQVVDKQLLAEEEMENAEFTDAKVLSEMPEYLSNDGQVLLQDQDGKLKYLAEMQPQYYAPYNRQY